MKEILRKALAASTADYCEIRVEESHVISFGFNGKELDGISQNVRYGGNVRALVNGGWGFVTFNSLDNLAEQVKKAENQARAIALFSTKKAKLASVPVVEDEVRVRFKKDPRTVSLADKVELFSKYNNQVLSFDSRIVSSRISYHEKHTNLYFANSEGTYIHQEILDLGGGIVAYASLGGERTQEYVTFGSSNDFGVAEGLEAKIAEACEVAVKMLTAPTVKGGQYTVIADPYLAGAFAHEAFGHLSEADNCYENEELQKLMQLGAEFGSPDLTIYDSGIEEGHRGYLKYDDEGVATERTYLIKNGKLVGRLHSRLTAGEMGERPTGNARAISYQFPPICRMRCTCIAPGNATLEEMLADVELGIYAQGAYGGETDGEMFTFIPSRAYMIRNGKICELVKNVSISGNVSRTLRDIDMIGSDFVILDSGGGCGKGAQQGLPTSAGAPHIRIRNVVVGGDR